VCHFGIWANYTYDMVGEYQSSNATWLSIPKATS
jgi:hypothetical protein